MRWDRTPAADKIEVTIEEWSKSLNRRIGRKFVGIEKIDAPRIQAGFDWLIDNSKAWPSPAHLYERMPPRPHRDQLPEQASNEKYEVGLRKIREIIEGIESWQAR